MMVRLIALALAMGAAAPVHAQAVNDYPTNARAEYVFACMATNGQTRDMLDRCSCAIDQIAEETGKNVPQIALSWLLQRTTVCSLIVGARNEEQLRQNLGAVGWNLTREQVATLEAASAVPMAYPYWHQQSAAGPRNPLPYHS